MQPIQIKVGAGGLNPNIGATEFNDPSLKGITGYVDKSGSGILEFSKYQILSSGGFRLLNGVTFAAGEVFTLVPVGLSYENTATTSYSNGFDFSKVLNALFGRVGWLQTPEAPALSNTNLISKGGRKFNDSSFHALVTLANIKSVMEQKNASDADFNAYIESMQRAIVLRCLNGVFSEPEYISQSLLYDRQSFGAYDQAVDNTGSFVGIQIKVPNQVDIAVQIDSIALHFDSVKTFNLYVFSDLKAAPIYTKEVTTEAGSQTVVDLEDFVLNYVGGNNLGGIFYIGYFQNDLGATKAIRENNVCFKANAPYGAVPVKAKATGAVSFDRQQISHTLSTNGLNPHFSVFRDHTWQIVKKPALFDNVIGLQMAAQVVELILFSTRSNGTERILKDDTMQAMGALALEGVVPISDGPSTVGLKKQITKELERLKKSFFPKSKSQGVNVC